MGEKKKRTRFSEIEYDVGETNSEKFGERIRKLNYKSFTMKVK